MFIGAVFEAVNECEAGNSPPDTGGVDATSRRSREAPFNGADGVVENGPLLWNAFRNTSANPTTPSAPLRWLRIFFLMAQPPLLYQEGSGAPNSFRPSNDRANSRFV